MQVLNYKAAILSAYKPDSEGMYPRISDLSTRFGLGRSTVVSILSSKRNELIQEMFNKKVDTHIISDRLDMTLQTVKNKITNLRHKEEAKKRDEASKRVIEPNNVFPASILKKGFVRTG